MSDTKPSAEFKASLVRSQQFTVTKDGADIRTRESVPGIRGGTTTKLNPLSIGDIISYQGDNSGPGDSVDRPCFQVIKSKRIRAGTIGEFTKLVGNFWLSYPDEDYLEVYKLTS